MKDTHELLREYMIKPKGMFIWRDVLGYEGRYQISNHGDVCSILNRVIAENDTQVVLVGVDKSRHSISRNKLLKNYWKENERYKGEEQWTKLDHYGDYYVSNYGNIKNCRRQIVRPSEGKVTLIGEHVRESVSLVKLFLNTFPPYEVEINHESQTVNYKKKYDIVTSSKQRTA